MTFIKQAYNQFTDVDWDIVKRYPFWCDSRFDNKHADVYFYMNLHNDGIAVYVDTDFNIRHEPSDWHKVSDR